MWWVEVVTWLVLWVEDVVTWVMSWVQGDMGNVVGYMVNVMTWWT